MERQEIEAELNEVERDLADIARRAHIAASNLRSVADELDGQADDPILELIAKNSRRFERGCVIIKDSASSLQTALGETMATAKALCATVAAMKGGAE